MNPLLWSALFGAVASAFAFAGELKLDNYKCVLQDQCGAVSQVCIFVQGAPNNCVYCNGNFVTDLCQRAQGASCDYAGQNQACGQKLQGTCGANGLCTGNIFQLACSVPKC